MISRQERHESVLEGYQLVAVVAGDDFRRRLDVEIDGQPADVSEAKQVQLALALNKDSGQYEWLRTDEIPDEVELTDLPRLDYDFARGIDLTDVDWAQLETILGHGASVAHPVDIQKEWEQDGAVSGFRMPKTDGFALKR
jgi:hypothetical protein